MCFNKWLKKSVVHYYCSNEVVSVNKLNLDLTIPGDFGVSTL